MSKSEIIRVSMEHNLEKEVKNIFSELRLSKTISIDRFYRQVKLVKDPPFNSHPYPNAALSMPALASSKPGTSGYREFCQ